MRHVAGIDTWRGLSVVLVVMHHVAIRLPLTKSAAADWLPQRLLLAANWNGYEAVLIFFVISGFLITTRTLERDGAPATVDLRAFWVRRAARIGPPLAALVAVLSALHLLGVPHHTIDVQRQSLALAITSAVTFWLNVYEARTGYLPGGWDVLWSLSIEEVFYLGFPLLLRATRREGVLAAVLVPFALALPWLHGTNTEELWREKAYLPGMAAIAAGVVAAVAARSLPASRRRDQGLVAVGAAAVAATLGWGDHLWPVLGEGTLLVHVGGVATAIVGAHGLRADAPWAVTAPLRSFGRWSYEIYLTHMFVVFALVSAYAAAGWGKREGAWAYPLALAGSWALGRAFARLWSEPANTWVRARLGG